MTAQGLAPDRAEVPEVAIGHYLLASSGEYVALQTSGLGPCVAVTLYDQQAQQGALLHVSAPVDIGPALAQIIQEFKHRGGDPTQLVAQLLGGWDDSLGALDGTRYESARMVNQILVELAKHQILVVKNSTLTTMTDLNNGAPLILDIELDLQTGEVYRYQPSVAFSGGEISSPMPTDFLQNAPL